MSFRKLTLLLGLLVMVATVAAACGGSDSGPADTPAAQAATLAAQEEECFKQAGATRALTESKFANFRDVFGRSRPVRERLISALLEVGVGTAFIETLEALEQIEPPSHFQAAHLELVGSTRQLADLDAKAVEAVKDGDLVTFVLVNGQLGEVSLSAFIGLPAVSCNGLNPAGSPGQNLCSLIDPLPGEEYGVQLNELMRRFEPQFGAARGALGFPLSLSEEELAQVFLVQTPIVATLLAEARSSVGA